MGWRNSDAAFTLGAVAVLVRSLWIPSVHAGNTTCASRQLDWYSSVVGESPCTTYERLRQICNPDYQVPDFLPTVPGDRCNEQVSACCCNSIAFQLSMLCMNCQYVTVDGSAVGYDAPIGSYTTYRATCGPGQTFHQLPADIQKAVCNKDIRLDDFLYGGWVDGSWFYVWTKENASKEHAVNNGNILQTRCAKSPSVTPTPTTTKPDDPNNSKTNSPPTTTTASPNDPTGTSQPTHTTGLTTEATGTTQTTGHTTETTGTTGTATPTEMTAAGVPTTGLTGNDKDTDNADTATAQGSSSPTGLTAQDSTNTSEHSNVSAIVGGVVGGVGTVVLVIVAFVLWKIRRSNNAKSHVTPPDNPYPYAYRDDPFGSPTGFVTPSMGQAGRERAPSPSPSPPPSAMDGSAALLVTRTSVGRTRSVDSSPRSRGTSVLPSPQPTATTTAPSLYASEDLSRHEDGGPVVQLVRSPSGRLPPAYRSWEQAEGAPRRPSDAFPRSVSDAVSQASEAPEHVWERQGDVYSESHHTPSASLSTMTAPSTAPPSVPAQPSEKASLYGNVPLAPMRRVDEK